MEMKQNVLEAVNKQINAELYSAYLYLSMSASLEDKNLRGMAKWVKIQAKEEVTHAMKFYGHLIDRNERAKLSAIEMPQHDWESPLLVFEDAYKHEQKVTGLINNLMTLANQEKDYALASLLKWFVDEQVEEEAQTNEIAVKLGMIKDMAGALLILDHELGKRKEAE